MSLVVSAVQRQLNPTAPLSLAPVPAATIAVGVVKERFFCIYKGCKHEKGWKDATGTKEHCENLH